MSLRIGLLVVGMACVWGGRALGQLPTDTLRLTVIERYPIRCVNDTGQVWIGPYSQVPDTLPDSAFERCQNRVQAEGKSDRVDAYTARLELENRTSRSEWVLMLRGWNISGVRVGLMRNGVHQSLTHNVYETVQGPKHIAIPLSFEPGQPVSLYIASRDYDIDVELFPSRVYYQYFAQNIYPLNSIYLVYFSIMGVLVVFYGIYAFASKESLYRYYLLFMICFGGFVLLEGNYLMAQLAINLTFGVWHFSVLLGFIALSVLARFVQGYYRALPSWAHRWQRVGYALTLAVGLVHLGLFLFDQRLYRGTTLLAHFTGLYWCGWMLALSWNRYRAKAEFAGRFLVAFWPFLLVMCLGLGNLVVSQLGAEGLGRMYIDLLLLLASVYQSAYLLAILGNRTYRTQQALITKHQEALALAEENQQITEEYTQELEEHYKLLKQTQDQLALSEKLSTLGQLAAGIIHEINTPLGVAKSTTDNQTEVAHKLLALRGQLLNTLTGDQLQAVEALAHELVQGNRTLSTREERTLRRQTTEQLTAWGVPDPDRVAQQLVLAGLQVPVADYPALFSPAYQADAVQLAAAVATLAQNQRTTQDALRRIHLIVQSLKKYAYRSGSDHVETFDLAENVQT
ncbi:MAG: hypothetical protein SFY70_06065, partial [Bacteroidia bacterium]|nr:hypothetical protein [Bacteroidia bacterium]